ncbi:transcription initiation factor IIB [Linderina macrospora]|uniref:Transcription initiation factor IIB n=1 Tax=Linderina macrospora TaxID=4868 RepID=A0ACC1IZE2_9FUNG|nr:transcription initiation factor IIB [Linderina macrospora]
MDLPTQITQTACNLYQQASASSLQRGKSTDAVVATCIFLACRQEGAPRTFKEICALTRVPRKDIGRTFKLLKDKLGADAKGMEAGAFEGVCGQVEQES